MLLHKLCGDAVITDQADLRPCLDSHVAKAHSLVHDHGFDGAAGILHGFVGRAGVAETLDGAKRNVLCHHTVTELTVPIDSDRLRNLHPSLTSGQDT